MNAKRIVCGLGTALALAACSNSDLTQPSASLQLTAVDTATAAAISAADATAEDVDVMAASDGTMNGAAPMYDLVAGPSFASEPSSGDSVRFAFWTFGSGCTYSAASGRFVCPDITRNGLTLSRSAAFADAAGAAMSRYNDTTTASANFLIGVNGVRTVAEGADTVSRTRAMTASRLLGHETSRTWNGSGTRVDGGFRIDSARTRTYHTQDAVTFANVVVTLPRSLHPWPISGTVTRQISGTGSVVAPAGTRSFSVARTVTITFNGTRYVPMMVGSIAFTLDLFTGKARRA